MVPCQVPFWIQLCHMIFKGLLTKTCICNVILSRYDHEFIIHYLNPQLTSSVKWPINASSSSVPCFHNSLLDLLFETTCKKSPLNSFSYPSLTLIISAIGSCILHVFQFSIRYGGSFMLSTNAVSITVNHIFLLLVFMTAGLEFSCIWCNRMVFWNTLAFHHHCLELWCVIAAS